MTSSQARWPCAARALIPALALALLCMSAAGRAQITLPYAEGFEGTSAMTLTAPVVVIPGAPDFGYYPNAEAVGPFDNLFGAGSGSTLGGLVFNVVNNPIILNGVFVYPTSTGSFGVEIRSSGNVLVGATPGMTVTAAMLGVKTYVPMDLVVPLGFGYRMQHVGTAALFRNTAGAAYPYTGMMNPGTNVTITGNTFTNPAHYPYFFDWQINSGTVPSPGEDARARTDVFPQTGIRALFMNKAYCTFVDTQGFLVLTLDMSNYTTASTVGLHFGLRRGLSAEFPDPNDRVWVRGRSTDAWIVAGDLGVLTPMSAQYYDIHLDVSSLLQANAQTYSPTFQVRWGQEGAGTCPDTTSGYTIDNVLLDVVPQTCGNGVMEGFETCDDGNTAAGDGCSAGCAVESGWACMGSPSTCAPICGDGLVVATESCDDGNITAGDGCDGACAVEHGYVCMGEPSVCTSACGDGLVAAGAEACDDGNAMATDGCDGACEVEPGWTCTGEPSACTTTCGDAVIAGAEECDKGDTDPGDGCSTTCSVEPGWTCIGQPSVCLPVCGDGILAGEEACDDDNVNALDGCDAVCRVEEGFECTGEPSDCRAICGDGLVRASEECDDGGVVSGDGCDAHCTVEPGFECEAEPSVCTPTCGDGAVRGGEECDDGNIAPGDGCSAECRSEAATGSAGPPGGDIRIGVCGCRAAGAKRTPYGAAAILLCGLLLAQRRRMSVAALSPARAGGPPARAAA